ncbi:MAG: molybdopterin-synthase adenylyltransferase MoeB [Gemmatimonadetes bacterium]|nr:molybdopterin-synthase adenylyltransferase MoeB [Gemmatimonadota bacterium]
MAERETPELESPELSRYARHLSLPEIGKEGQLRLKASRVVVVGAGGLGSPLALYLVAAGIGTLGLVDFDEVDATNLQRQILHGTRDIGRQKLDSARERLADVNPNVSVVTHDVRLDSGNALEILGAYDIVADGTDNFPTRYLVNDACVLLGKPNVYGAVFRWEGQASVFASDGGPCYRCLFQEPPAAGLVQNCAEAGVLGVLPGIIGSIQALEVIKLILGQGRTLSGRLLIFDALEMSWREMAVSRNINCPVCGEEPTQTELIDYEDFCGMKASIEGKEEEMVTPFGEVGAVELNERLASAEPPFLLDVRQPHEWDIVNLETDGAVMIPLAELRDRLEEIPTDREIVVYCRTGARSASAAQMLADEGFSSVFNFVGGIRAWVDEIDPSLPKY